MEMEHHQHSASNLGVDATNLTRREQQLSDRVEQLHLLWHLIHPLRNGKAKSLLRTKQLANDFNLLLTAILTGNANHLDHIQRMPASGTANITEMMREKIDACGIPIEQLTALQLVELIQQVHSNVLDDTEETIFGENG